MLERLAKESQIEEERLTKESAIERLERLAKESTDREKKLAKEREEKANRQEVLSEVTLASLKNEKLFRIDHNAPPEPSTEEEVRARAA